jgi:hypothetical protein
MLGIATCIPEGPKAAIYSTCTGVKYAGNTLTIKETTIYKWDFYFCALGFLVVLSFPQLLSFSSVFPKPLSETLTRSSDRRNPVQLTIPC